MSYRLDPEEPVGEELKRIVREEIDAALSHIATDSGTERDKAIHETRKSVKKIRAIIRLLRPRLPKIYARENRRVRAVGRELSTLRDAAAIVETVDELAGGTSRLRVIRAGLLQAKTDSGNEIKIEEVLRHTAASLNKLKERVGTWPVRNPDVAAFQPAIGKAYRRGRKLLKLARRHPDPAIWHEFRKRVKDHWYHVRLLEEFAPDAYRRREKPLNELETRLGTDHNLVVLTDELMKTPDRFGGEKPVAAAIALIGKYQRKLRKEALALGGALYENKTYVTD